ncbi:ATP-dependent nuclease [Microbacterium sp. NPDC055665]
MEIAGLGKPWGARWGDPITHRSRTLVGGSSIDILLNVASGSKQSLYLLQEGIDRPLEADDDILIIAFWGAATRADAIGSIGVLWTALDRAEGRAPIAVDADEIERLFDDPARSDATIPRAYTHGFTRVRPMSRSDKRRRNSERRGKPVNGEQLSLVRVSQLEFRGLRGFRSDAKLRLAQPNGSVGSGLTIVVGENNAGKSTVWEAFDSLARKMRSDVSFSEGRRNQQTEGGVRIRLDREDGSSYLLESKHSETSETHGSWEASGSAEAPAFELVSVPARRQFQPSFSKGGTVERDWMISQAEFSRARQADQFMQFTGRLFDLHNDDVKKARFDQLMAEVIGSELEWSIELSDGQYGQSYYLKVINGGGSHTSDGLGDGIISLMFIINALYDSEPSTLLTIDEPELSLHPQLVRRLGRVISRLAADRQIVIFTHAPALISWDDIAAGGEVARVYRRDRESRIAQASREAIAEISKARGGWTNPHALGLDANAALFLDDGVIVVEGQEDAALLPRVFEKLGVAFNGTIFGWGSGGANNVERVLTLLRELGFSRVAAVLDNDVPEVAARLTASFEEYLIVEQPASDIRDKPSNVFKGKDGLLDARGRTVKPHLEEAARGALTRVSEYLRPEPQSLGSAHTSHG